MVLVTIVLHGPTSSNSGNYSVSAGTGWDGYCYTSGMDGAKTYVTNGGAATGWSTYFNSHPPTNGFHNFGVLGRDNVNG